MPFKYKFALEDDILIYIHNHNFDYLTSINGTSEFGIDLRNIYIYVLRSSKRSGHVKA
jgi:hypothetical protein